MPSELGAHTLELWAAIGTVIGTWVLVVGALVSVWLQAKTARADRSASTVMVLRDRFNSPGLRRQRQTLSLILLRGGTLDLFHDQVLTFFETIGFSVSKGTLDAMTVWNEFSFETILYWQALIRSKTGDQIQRLRHEKHDITLYDKFEFLRDRFLKIEQNKRHGVSIENIVPSDSEIQEFLQHEAAVETVSDDLYKAPSQ